MEGVCVRFGGEGYGFIEEDETLVRWFVHVSDIPGHRALKVGDRVRFVQGASRGKAPRAINIEIIQAKPRVTVLDVLSGRTPAAKGASDVK
jgi:cold shock CspA family protein